MEQASDGDLQGIRRDIRLGWEGIEKDHHRSQNLIFIRAGVCKKRSGQDNSLIRFDHGV